LAVARCNFAATCFLQASEPGFSILLVLFLIHTVHSVTEHIDCGVSARAWWNNHRMKRVYSASAWILAFLTVLLKTLGLSETVFEVTRKDQGKLDAGEADTEENVDPGRFC
jgi:Ni/Fe-hydrogenase subunit HybB-like protein